MFFKDGDIVNLKVFAKAGVNNTVIKVKSSKAKLKKADVRVPVSASVKEAVEKAGGNYLASKQLAVSI